MATLKQIDNKADSRQEILMRSINTEQKNLEELQATQKEVENAITQRKNEIATLEKTLTDTQVSLDNLVAHSKELGEKQRAENKAHADAIRRYNSDIERLSKERDTLRADIESLHSSYANQSKKVQQNMTDLEARIQNLEIEESRHDTAVTLASSRVNELRDKETELLKKKTILLDKIAEQEKKLAELTVDTTKQEYKNKEALDTAQKELAEVESKIKESAHTLAEADKIIKEKTEEIKKRETKLFVIAQRETEIASREQYIKDLYEKAGVDY